MLLGFVFWPLIIRGPDFLARPIFKRRGCCVPLGVVGVTAMKRAGVASALLSGRAQWPSEGVSPRLRIANSTSQEIGEGAAVPGKRANQRSGVASDFAAQLPALLPVAGPVGSEAFLQLRRLAGTNGKSELKLRPIQGQPSIPQRGGRLGRGRLDLGAPQGDA